MKALTKLLIEALDTDDNGGEYNTKSIMAYGKICQHDDGYLCKCRRDWILKQIEKK